MDQAAALAPGRWLPELLVALALGLAAVTYARGWSRLRRRMPHRFGWRQLVCFLAGLDVILVAIVSPIDAYAARSLLLHMIQHLLLTLAAPPLIWLGAPVAPMLRGLPPPAARIVILGMAWPPLRRLGSAVTHPTVCWVAFFIATWAWHIPALYELALSSHTWHHVEHGSFLGAALLFWWPVAQPWPSRSRWPRWAMVPYLLLAEIHSTILAAFFVFAGRVVYPTYAAIQGAAGALQDQVAAGVIMWGPGSLTFLVPTGYLVMRLLAPVGTTAEDRGLPAMPAL